MFRKLFSLLLSFTLLYFPSCKKANEYDYTPNISFKSFTTDKDASGRDILGHITISFTDGDGDLGLDPADTLSTYSQSGPYYYNFIITYHEKNSSGVWTTPTLAFPLSGRFITLTPQGRNKALRGDITMDVFLRPGATNLTTKYDIFIYDRALHHSNPITTPEITITTP